MGVTAVVVASVVGAYQVSESEKAKKDAKQQREDASNAQAAYEADLNEKQKQEKVQSEMFQRRARQRTSASQSGGRSSTIRTGTNAIGGPGAAPIGDVLPASAGGKTILGT